MNKQPSPINICLRIECDAESSRYRRAAAYLERLANPSLFPDPTIEENEFAVAYYNLKARAELLAHR
jgi:hypothetical protein